MAVNINTVYQRVLAIANKEQNGYLTPQEFNVFANQAQIEIFEQYFYDVNQFGRVKGNSTEYSDMLNVLDEKLLPFKRLQKSAITQTKRAPYAATFGNNLVTNGTFETDISNWTAGTADSENGGSQEYDSVTQSIKLENDAANNVFKSKQTITTVVGTLYRVKAYINANSLNASTNNTGASANIIFSNRPSNKIPAGYSETVEFFVTASSTSTTFELIITSENGNTSASDFALFDNIEVKEVGGTKLSIFPSVSYNGFDNDIYMLGTVIYTDSNGNMIEVDKALPNDFLYINSSPLTKPSLTNPVYVAEENHETNYSGIHTYDISVYPSSIGSGEISVNYIVKPGICRWAYNIVNEKPLYDAVNSFNFELHASESNTLVNKILELAGISMQKDNIQNSAVARDNKEIQQQKA
tara:strand:- start:12911 stop:14146 length:1236 start_codon:yes stop_codon:yes gene_type:complete